jgi:drug/metabolite transporter (DMT)-like permease
MSAFSMISAPAFGAACALGSAVTWAITSLIVRSLAPHVSAVTLNATRSVVAGGLLVGFVLATTGSGTFAAISPRAFWLMAVSVVAAISIGDTIFFESARLLGLGRAMTIAMTYPVGSALLAWLFLDEVLTPQLVAGTLLTLGGIALIVLPRAERTPGEAFGRGVAAATVASLAWAISVICMKPALQEVDPVTAQAVRLPLAGALLWVTPWARGGMRALVASQASVRWRVLGLSVLTAGSSVLFVAGLKYAGVTVSTVLSSTAPLFAIPLGWAFLGEKLSATAVLGGLVTVAGIIVLQI